MQQPGETLETHIHFSTILHKSSAAFAGAAHPRFKQISNMARRMLRNMNIKHHTETQQDLPSSGLLYKYHVCQENKSIEFELRNCCRFFNTFLDGKRHTSQQLSQFELLFLMNLRKKR